MRALLTGGAGFIGSHLSDALLQAGHKVTVLDDLSTGPMEAPNLQKIHDLIGYEPQVNLEEILTRVIDYFQKR